jgi:hypothetical protein
MPAESQGGHGDVIQTVSQSLSSPDVSPSVISPDWLVTRTEARNVRNHLLHTGALSGPNQGLCIRVTGRLERCFVSESPAATLRRRPRCTLIGDSAIKRERTQWTRQRTHHIHRLSSRHRAAKRQLPVRRLGRARRRSVGPVATRRRTGTVSPSPEVWIPRGRSRRPVSQFPLSHGICAGYTQRENSHNGRAAPQLCHIVQAATTYRQGRTPRCLVRRSSKR